jgi:hypothetical protein
MSFTFLRWVRFGVAAALGNSALPAGGGPRAKIDVFVELQATPPQTVSSPNAKLSAFGPGDVVGLDARQVIRTFPVGGTQDFEPTFRAHVELDRPDLPWLFTPVAPDANNLLRPWLALVVIEKREGVAIEPASPLPVLAIESGAGAELPSLAEIAAWAHVQITGEPTTPVDVIARDNPERILSRVICPRVLEPLKSYIACVVPTYNVGVTAGLGGDVANDAAISDAWNANTDGIRLPIYHHWEFATGGTGDFKSLVTRLEAHIPGANVGTRPLDITTPRFTVPDLPASTQVPFGGALRVTTPAPAPTSEELAQALLRIVNANGTVGPPIYGRWHAAATSVARGTGVPRWLDALNLDARYRVAAGLGTRVVQDRQEDLMAAVWEQFGEIIKANQLLRQAQLAIAASERTVSRHFSRQSDAVLLQLAGPALSRMRLAPGKTIRRAVAESCLPLGSLTGAFRRIARTHGPLERRFAHRARTGLADYVPPAIDVPTLIQRLAQGALNARPAQRPDGAVATPREYFSTRRRPIIRGETPTPEDELIRAFNVLASRDTRATCTPLDVGAVAQTIREALVPDVAIPPRVRAQIKLPATRAQLSNRLDPLLAAPEIPTPMIGPLIEMGQDFLLPGLGELPPNTVCLVEPDAAFIEAYFVGLNHEMGRELLWRGFPTDQRGTVFSRFWDRRGAVPGATPVSDSDIQPIAGWRRTEALGTHLTQAASDLVVLLIRGELLQRYPRATIYLQEAKWARDTTNAIVYEGNVAKRIPVPVTTAQEWDQHARFPAFTGRVGGDLVFMGFMLPRRLIRGLDRTELPPATPDSEAGWYIVFQEQPTEPRFGSAAPAGNLGTAKSEAIAATLMRSAFRLFVHASDLVRP